MEYDSIFGHGAYLGPDFTTTTCTVPCSQSRASTAMKVKPTRPSKRRSTTSRQTAMTRRPTPCSSGCASWVTCSSSSEGSCPCSASAGWGEVPGQASDPRGARGDSLHRRDRAGAGGSRPVSAETIAATALLGVPRVLRAGTGRSRPRCSQALGRFRMQGFSYDARLNLWVCPEGEQLRPVRGRPLATVIALARVLITPSLPDLFPLA